jgi:hypothetical protein
MYRLTGGCHCGNIGVAMDLAREPGTYTPRTCDCDYCRKHSAAYISDAQGSLVIRVTDPSKLGRYRQGAGLAEFLFCTACSVLVSVLYNHDTRLYAAVNANAIDARERFGEPQSASPKTLSAQEKMQRWQELWFCQVKITD